MRTKTLTRGKLLPALLAAAFLPAAAIAAEPGFYAGAKIGAASVESDFIDDDDTSYGAYAGWQFNPYFAVEGVYTNFGDVEVDLDDLEIENPGLEPDSIGVRALGTFPVGERFDILAGIGWHAFDLNPNTGDGLIDAIGDDSNSDLFYGVGAQFNFGNNFALRVMYDRFEFEGSDADEISLGAHFTF